MSLLNPSSGTTVVISSVMTREPKERHDEEARRRRVPQEAARADNDSPAWHGVCHFARAAQSLAGPPVHRYHRRRHGHAPARPSGAPQRVDCGRTCSCGRSPLALLDEHRLYQADRHQERKTPSMKKHTNAARFPARLAEEVKAADLGRIFAGSLAGSGSSSSTSARYIEMSVGIATETPPYSGGGAVG